MAIGADTSAPLGPGMVDPPCLTQLPVTGPTKLTAFSFSIKHCSHPPPCHILDILYLGVTLSGCLER